MLKINKISIFILYLIGIFYLVEILLYFFLSKDQKLLINIHQQRLKIAKERNIDYDTRSKVEAYLAEKKKNKNLFIPFYLNRSHYDLDIVKKGLEKNISIPFRGPINKKTLSCNEDLKFKIINNDQYGFKNPNEIYLKKIDAILLGDSYAEGLCENEINDTAGHLRSLGLNTINYGVTGTGPLTSLAIAREYIKIFKPKYVIYLYFEGNDLRDLNWEKNTFLNKYLKKNFTLNYIDKQNDFKIFLENFQKKRIIELNKVEVPKKNNQGENKFFSVLKDILEFTNIKGILRSNFISEDNKVDMNLFFQTLDLINDEAKNIKSELIFVYVPSWSRYYTKFNKDKILFKKKDEIINYVYKKKINLIDFEDIIKNSDDKKLFFPLGYIGHFNSNGYKLLADSIKKNID